MPMFPETWMDELLQKTDLASLVSEYVPLSQKSGRLWGCCPFHNEKTPSFSVQPDKQMYYCFGCHAGGGAIQFVREIERLSFVDAVKFLAQRAGMELPDEVDDDRLRRERAHKERLYAASRRQRCFTTVSCCRRKESRRRHTLQSAGWMASLQPGLALALRWKHGMA